MKGYNYKCIVSKNGTKTYYKRDKSKKGKMSWKKMNQKSGKNAEKGKRKYKKGLGDLLTDLKNLLPNIVINRNNNNQNIFKNLETTVNQMEDFNQAGLNLINLIQNKINTDSTNDMSENNKKRFLNILANPALLSKINNIEKLVTINNFLNDKPNDTLFKIIFENDALISYLLKIDDNDIEKLKEKIIKKYAQSEMCQGQGGQYLIQLSDLLFKYLNPKQDLTMNEIINNTNRLCNISLWLATGNIDTEILEEKIEENTDDFKTKIFSEENSALTQKILEKNFKK